MHRGPQLIHSSFVLRTGHWLFSRRGWLPIPLVLVAVGVAQPSAWRWVGLGVLFIGEGVRLWGVAHIGARSRTRSADVGPLVESGPFEISRNPLYIGNIALWFGVGLAAGSPLMAVAFLSLMGVHYSLVVRWEESVLTRSHGEAYEAYCSRVPRWGWGSGGRSDRAGRWWAAMRSERSTLLALGLVVGAILGFGTLAG